MDSCMTCARNVESCYYYLRDGYDGNTVGCPNWEPAHDLNVRRSIDEGRPVEQDELERESDIAAGFILGLIVAVVIWAVIFWLIWTIF